MLIQSNYCSWLKEKLLLLLLLLLLFLLLLLLYRAIYNLWTLV